MLDAIIGAASGIQSTMIQWDQAHKEARRQRDHEYNEARRQREYDYRMWQEQNAYNDPSAQMARLKAAGLNPNLIYGKGSMAGNVANTHPKYTKAGWSQVTPPDFAAGAQTGMQIAALNVGMRKEAAEIDKVQQAANLIKQQALNEGVRNAILINQSDKTRTDADLAAELKDYNIEAKRIQNENIKAEIQNKLATNKTLNADLSIKEQQRVNLVTQNMLENQKLNLAQYGIYPSDDALLRVLIQDSIKNGEDISDRMIELSVMQNLWSMFGRFIKGANFRIGKRPLPKIKVPHKR